MIDEKTTFEKYGYYSADLKPKSGKRVVAVCDGCEAIRYPMKCDYTDICIKCSNKHNPERIKNVIKANQKKAKEPEWLKNTAEANRKNSKDPNWIKAHKAGQNKPGVSKKKSDSMKKAHKEFPEVWISPDRGKKVSATKQGIEYDEWESYVTFYPYCPSFDEPCRESNRDKYDRKCFICNLLESENISNAGNYRKLSVHHYDMDKGQGCNGKRWKLVPLCLHCHANAHNKTWEARIEYLLGEVWNDQKVYKV